MHPQYMSILIYVTLIWCNVIPQMYCQLELGDICILSICAFCYMCKLFGVTVFQRSIVNWSGGGLMYAQYMCILLNVTLIWCNSISEIYCQLEWRGQMYPQYMCILLYVTLMWCNSIPQIYFQFEWRYMYPHYMCILLYVTLIWCNGISEIYCQLEWVGRCILSICAFCDMCILFGVTLFHRCSVNWSLGGQMYAQYMCIMLYVKFIWCNAIPYICFQLESGGRCTSVYVHYAISECYLV